VAPAVICKISEIAVIAVLGGSPPGGRWDVPRARARPRGRELGPTFTPGAILSSGTSTLGRACDLARISMTGAIDSHPTWTCSDRTTL